VTEQEPEAQLSEEVAERRPFIPGPLSLDPVSVQGPKTVRCIAGRVTRVCDERSLGASVP
jgi:hypothetical protein